MTYSPEAFRRFLMDYTSKNKLISGEEFSDQMLADARDYIIDDFNTSPPDSIVFSEENVPNNLLYPGMAYYLLESAAMSYRRNRLDYRAGNVSISDQNKEGEYSQAANYYYKKYEMAKAKLKVQKNWEQGWGCF